MKPPSSTLRRALLGTALLAIVAGLICAALGLLALSARDPIFLGDRLRRFAQLVTLTAPLHLVDRIPPVVTASRVLLISGYALAIAWAVTALTRPRLERFAVSRMHGHLVVCGSRPLEGEHEGPIVRLHDTAPTTRADRPGLTWLTGRSDEHRDLKRVGADRARSVFILGDDTELNLRSAAAVESLHASGHGNPLRYVVEIGDDDVRRGLDALRPTHGVEHLDRQLFFRDRAVARALFQDHPLIDPGVPYRRLRLMVVGCNGIGRQIILESMRSGINDERGPSIVILDSEPDRALGQLRDRYAAIDTVCDLEALALDPLRPRSSFAATLDGSQEFDAIFLCDDHAEKSIGLLAALHTGFRDRDLARPRVFVHGRRHEQLLTALAAERGETHGAIVPFGDDHRVYRIDEFLGDRRDRLAQAIHREYRETLRAIDSPSGERPSDREWSHLPTSFRDANRHQADHIEVKLRTIGCVTADGPEPGFVFTEAEVERLARLEHVRWMAERILEGWRYGAKRDDERRIHPSIRPYDELADAEQELDRAAVRQIPSLLSSVGRSIRRVRAAEA